MRKAQIHFSNSLEALGEVIKQNLFPENSHPFDQRIIIVPHPHLKTFLMQSFVNDEHMQIAAGIQVVTLHQAIEKITGKTFPSKMLLSLFIEYAIIPLIETENQLQEYFDHPAFEQRIGSFCDHLSNLFMEHGVHGNKALLPWQDNLWQQIKKKWIFPIQLSELQFSLQHQFHLFGFSYLPSSYLDFFHNHRAQFYFFSPCQVFWEDFFSQKKQIFLEKQFSKNAQEDFLKSFEDQNYLLAQCGQLGQKLLGEIEKRNLITEEHYIVLSGNTYLHELQQNLLDGQISTGNFDESIQCFSAPSKLREIEVLKEQLLKLMEKSIFPSEIQVFAPNINDYTNHIHAVFGQTQPVIPYSISGLEIQHEDLVVKALVLLINLLKERFSFDAVFSFLHSPLVMEKLQLSTENLYLLHRWMKTANVQWGISAEQRQKISAKEMPGVLFPKNSHIGTWQNGLMRLVLGMGQIEGNQSPLNVVESTQIETLEEFFQIIQTLEQDLSSLVEQIPQTIPCWIETILALLYQYISEDHSHEISRDLLDLLQETQDLDQRKISFTSFERVIQQLLGKKNHVYLAPHLQAIRFASLAAGCSQPSKAIHILGLQEQAFPRKESFIISNEKEKQLAIGQMHKDQYLFLELLLNVRQYFSLSFQTSEEKEPSLLITQLLSQGNGAHIHEHAAFAFDPKYFVDQPGLIPLHYLAAKSSLIPQKTKPLIPEFYYSHSLSLPKLTQPLTIEFRMLVKLAKHPVRFFFNEILKIFPEYPESKYLIPPFVKQQLVKEALHSPIEKVLQKAEGEGKLPKNAFRSAMQAQIINEVEEWKTCLKHFDLSPGDIGAMEFHPFCKTPKQHPEGTWIYPAPSLKLDGHEIRIVGRIENWTPQGLIVKGEETLENLLVFWPHYLILKHLGIGSLIFVEDRKQVSLEIEDNAIENYLRYFLLASSSASPLIPTFAKALVQGSAEDLNKALKNMAHDPDEVFKWLSYRDPQPNSQAIYENWSEILKQIFYPLIKNI